MSVSGAQAAPAGANHARLGVLIALLGMFLFALNDAMGKWLVATYSVGQVLLIRSLFALVIILVLLRGAGVVSMFRIERKGVQAGRVVFSTAEVFCFYTAVTYLPLADVMTYWLAAPIYVAALSPFLLGERVGPLRWSAIAIGFVGVVVALGPTGTVAPFATGAAILGSLSFALMILTGRTLRGTPDMALVFWQNAGALAAGLVLAPLSWVTPTPMDLGLLGMLGIVAMTAHMCINRALKLADASTIAPIQYTLLLYAIILGWLFFGDVPHPMMLAGAAIIVASGLFIFVREQRRKHEPLPEASGPSREGGA
jgi:drug/metabolite transporter (DMT)-like permease